MSASALRELLLDGLVRVLRAYSPTFEEGEAVAALKDFTEDMLGFDEVRVDRVGNLVASYGDGGRVIAFVGHIDTVPGRIPVEVVGDRVRGRGAVDAKGPLISAFVGASMAKELAGNVKVKAVALVGEEGPSHGAWELVRSGERFDHMIILEPTGGRDVVIEYRGSASVVVRCVASGGHTSSPELGDSACDKLMRAWGSLRHELMSMDYVVALTKLCCGEGGGVLPRRGELVANLRIPYGKDEGDLHSALAAIEWPPNCSYSVMGYVPPVRSGVNTAVVRALFRALIREGVRPSLARKRGTSDMNILHGRVAAESAAYGPGDPALAHTDAEEISVDELVLGARVYARTVHELSRLGGVK